MAGQVTLIRSGSGAGAKPRLGSSIQTFKPRLIYYSFYFIFCRPANSTRGECAWLASTDPLFGTVADAWMEIMVADFGTDHWYQCDGFFTGAKPPWFEGAATNTANEGASVPLSAPAPLSHIASEQGEAPAGAEPAVEPDAQWTPVWKAAYNGMARTDPEAKWLYQGWAIRGWTDSKGAGRIKALKDAVP